jgi:hypothetical protein
MVGVRTSGSGKKRDLVGACMMEWVMREPGEMMMEWDWKGLQEIRWIEIEEGRGYQASARHWMSLWEEMVVEEQRGFPRSVRLSTCSWWLKLRFSDSDPVAHCALTMPLLTSLTSL